MAGQKCWNEEEKKYNDERQDRKEVGIQADEGVDGRE